MKTVRILPSLLAADFGNLKAEACRAELSGADGLHLDIMDGHFVPNLSMGPDVVRMARECLKIPLSVHLMMTRPDQHRFIERFIEAGADPLLIHIESDCDVKTTLKLIRTLGVKAGITLNPGTPAESILPFLDEVDEVLCMSVHPGYGGQKFIPEVLSKVRQIASAGRNRTSPLALSIDGGIDLQTAPQACEQGATDLIAGTSLFRASDMSRAISDMRQSAQAAYHRFIETPIAGA